MNWLANPIDRRLVYNAREAIAIRFVVIDILMRSLGSWYDERRIEFREANVMRRRHSFWPYEQHHVHNGRVLFLISGKSMPPDSGHHSTSAG